MTFDEYMMVVDEVRQDVAFHDLRLGQTYFNVLWKVRQDLAKRVLATDLDPFSLDSRIPSFLEFVEANW